MIYVNVQWLVVVVAAVTVDFCELTRANPFHVNVFMLNVFCLILTCIFTLSCLSCLCFMPFV